MPGSKKKRNLGSKIQNMEPTLEELFVWGYVSFLHSKELALSSKVLFENKRIPLAVASTIQTVEEFGRIIITIKAMWALKEGNLNWGKVREDLTDHVSKLKAVIPIKPKAKGTGAVTKNKTIKFEFKYNIEAYQNIFTEFLDKLDGESARKANYYRTEMEHIVFDRDVVTPLSHMTLEQTKAFAKLGDVCGELIKQIESVLEGVFGPIHQIFSTYYYSNAENSDVTMEKIIGIVKRFIPAIPLVFATFLFKELNIDIFIEEKSVDEKLLVEIKDKTVALLKSVGENTEIEGLLKQDVIKRLLAMWHEIVLSDVNLNQDK